MLVFIRSLLDTGSSEWDREQIIALVRSALYLVSFTLILFFALVDLAYEPSHDNAVYILVAGIVVFTLHCTEQKED